MTHVVLNIDSKKKWNALKTVLEAMEIDYFAKDKEDEISQQELELLNKAQSDVVQDKITTFTNHRDILGR